MHTGKIINNNPGGTKMKIVKKFLIAIVIFMGMTTAVNAAGVYGTLNLAGYDDYRHDLKGNTLALLIEESSSAIMIGENIPSTISSCTLVTFDKKASEKIRVSFDEAIGDNKVEIICFDKTWALLRVEGVSTMFYSVKLGKKDVSVLGSVLDAEFRFRFMSGKDLVSVLNTDNKCQLFNQKMEKIGSSVDLIGKAFSLNDGKYFYCGDGTTTKIYKVKKGFEEVISETGDYKAINQPKRICCIRDGDNHKICKY